MNHHAAKVAVSIGLVLVVAIGLQYLASYAVTGDGASFLLRVLGFLVAAAVVPLLLWFRSRVRA